MKNIADDVIEQEAEPDEIDAKMKEMMMLKESIFEKADKNIDSAQERYKKDYDKKRKLCQVHN